MGEFSIEASRLIAQPAEVIFAKVNDFKAWTTWSPWEHLDSDLERTYSGADSGVGAGYAWSGKKAGSGTMEIVKSQAPGRIEIDLRFTKPFKATNPTTFSFVPAEGGTLVTWRMSGHQGAVARAFFVLFGMARKVGADFEKGLADLAAAVNG